MPYGTKPSFKMKDKTGLYMLDKGKNSALPKYKDTQMYMGHTMKMYGKPMKMAHGDKPMKKDGMEKKSEKITKNNIKEFKKFGVNGKPNYDKQIKLMSKTGKQSWDIKQENQ